MLEALARRLPYLRGLHAKVDELRAEVSRLRGIFPPGHFYSPIPDPRAVVQDAARIFPPQVDALPGVDLNVEGQLACLERWGRHAAALPDAWSSGVGARYRFDNEYFSYGDAIPLFCALLELGPARFVEVGSGFSSALVLDTNERFLDGRIHCSFIEPFPERLRGLLRANDDTRATIHEKPVQAVELAVFDELQANDILFIDSSHVSKVGSDVNHLLFEVLPRLRPGVWVHVHDIFHPFEYPRSWIDAGFAWNEAYLLRAFLQYNTTFQIQFFASYLLRNHRDAVARCLPDMQKGERTPLVITDAPASSLWLRRC